MIPNNPTLQGVQQQAEQKIRQASPWVEKLARWGYDSKGVVYLIVGFLALQAAFNAGGKTTDMDGALATVANRPFGQFLLGVIAVGLLGYALWRFVQAFMDTENEGKDASGLATRAGFVLSALTYGGLALTAALLMMGGALKALEQQPYGPYVLGLVAVGLMAYALFMFVEARYRRIAV